MSNDNSSPKIFLMSYPSRERRDRRVKPAHQRDGLAYAFLQTAYIRRGYAFGEVLFNFANSRHFFDVSDMKSGDIIMQITRPPRDDAAASERGAIPLSHTNLERIIALRSRDYFDELRRSYVSLAFPYSFLLSEGFENRALAEIESQPGCGYRAWKRPGPGDLRPADRRRTPAYFLRTPPLWPNGPDLVLAFAMSSTETYCWNRMLSTRLRHIIESDARRFVVAELVRPPEPKRRKGEPPARPHDGSFVDAWDVEVLCDIELPLSDAMQHLARERRDAFRGEERFRA
jgi:hypothetical protein